MIPDEEGSFSAVRHQEVVCCGLTSFLAGLVDDPGTGSVSFSDQDHFRDMQDIVDFPGTAWEWLMTNTGWFIFITVAVLAVLGVVIFLF